MNERRIQAYLSLIDQLMNCYDGQETEILHAHQDLVDSDFLEVVSKFSVFHRNQGNEREAIWLHNLAIFLEEILGVKPSSSSHSQELSSRANDFIVKSLQVIAQCIDNAQNDFADFYQFLTANQLYINNQLLHAFPNILSAILTNSPRGRKRDSAILIATFGILIQDFSLGQQVVNTELAIIAFQQALQGEHLTFAISINAYLGSSINEPP